MLTIVAAILPVFLLILVGAGLRRLDFPGEAAWGPLSRLAYYVLFPALILEALGGAQLGALRVGPMAAAIVATLVAVMAVLLALRPRLADTDPAFSSVVQGSTRVNGYICLSLVDSIWGSAGLTVAAVAMAAIVPTVNVLAVSTLARFGHGGDPRVRAVVRTLARNPLIWAALAGIALNATGIGLPPVIGPMAEMLSRAALPLGLLIVGAALDFSAVRHDAGPIVRSAVLKLAVAPAFAAVFLWLFGVEGITADVALLFMAAPTATASYVLARELGGDARLMAGLVTAQTLASLVTLPVILVFVQ